MTNNQIVERIRVYDWVDSAHHFINTFTNKIELHSLDWVSSHSELSNFLVDVEDNLEIIYSL